ncbi:5-hydroxytryptamine receptor 4-like [Mercenaria mercenaria]|uniref:5-hydroxytryptamine receptor 4-like n=1 Tax=Mercenaria mercenaria TaxID=6596 RepID=UPI00234EC942|nr:5-hydroxytryptamine receptor 4-like [Mercenaria mercenaria]
MDNVSTYIIVSNTITSNNSCSKDETAKIEKVPKLVMFSVFVVLSVGVVCLNVILIAKLNRRHKYKVFTRFFLTSMAAVDLIVGLTVMPFNIANEFTDVKHLFGSRTCSLMNSADVMLTSSSIIHLSILTFERYVALCKPFSYLRICRRRNMIFLFLMCWLVVTTVSFGFIMPGLHHYGIEEQIVRCTVYLADKCIFIVNVYYDMLCSTLTFFIPGFLILCFNLKVLKHVRHESTKKKCVLNVASPHSRKSGYNSQNIHIARTIAVLTGCFFICWLPFFVVCKLVIFSYYNIPYIVEIVVLWLGYGNSAMNPLMYILLESKQSCIGKR